MPLLWGGTFSSPVLQPEHKASQKWSQNSVLSTWRQSLPSQAQCHHVPSKFSKDYQRNLSILKTCIKIKRGKKSKDLSYQKTRLIMKPWSWSHFSFSLKLSHFPSLLHSPCKHVNLNCGHFSQPSLSSQILPWPGPISP